MTCLSIILHVIYVWQPKSASLDGASLKVKRSFMQGDKLLIRKYHTKAANDIAGALLNEILSSPKRYVITIAGESGSGKTEIARELSRFLSLKGIRNFTLHQDDYFRLPPKTNYAARREDISLVGPKEVKLDLLNSHIASFRASNAVKIRKPLVFYRQDRIKSEVFSTDGIRVLIIEGTYATLLKGVDKKVFLLPDYKDTRKNRLARKRDRIDVFDNKILAIEHSVISRHSALADIIVKKDYRLDLSSRGLGKKISRICILSVHGYVDPKPILGKTDTGGQVTYVLELAKAMARMGVKVDIYTRRFHHKKMVERVARGVRIVRIPCCGSGFINKEKIFPCLDTFVNNMERFMKKNGLRYDIYHSHYWDAGYVAMKLTGRLGYFFIHTFHSLGAWKKEQMGGEAKEMEAIYNFRQRIKTEKTLYKKTRALVMTSPDMVGRSRKFYNFTGKNFIVLPAGVNTKVFRPLEKGEKERNIDVPQNYMFWVGRFDTNKGLDYLLRGFGEIVRKSKDLFLVIGGGSQKPKERERKLKANLENIIEDLKIKNRVFFAKHIKDHLMPAYYRKASFFVLPSKFEPFGMTGAEAMACGTALVVSNRAGLRRYLKNKKNCLIVNPVNKRSLGWALMILDRNASFRERIARKGLAVAREKFSWEGIASKSLRFYHRALEK
jgi:mannosylfructose-phosphate synthase